MSNELFKTCTRREQQKIKAIFFLLQTKNIERIFEIIKDLIKKERKDAKCRAKKSKELRITKCY
ncbi:MAG: hypothetical protein EOM50_23715 [Erysipelotrichia bacterium]|nr:hypothetical protein [Erysipelotrichia bacterium]